MWEQHKLECSLKDSLIIDLGDSKGNQFYNNYCTARDYLVDNIYGQIQGVEKDLTDHSEKHIYNVLSNVEKLMESSLDNLAGVELYCLMVMILFHDVGNISGRDEHNKNIHAVYNHARKKDVKFNQERRIITSAAKAHCGKTASGSRDTLKEVALSENLEGHKVRLQELAAILRLADELAEGLQRTSTYMIDKSKISEGSKIFHKYASVTTVFIDKGNSRIVLSYDIDICENDLVNSAELKELLDMIFHRIHKLDEERRYCKHYSHFLNDFKHTEVSLNFTYEGEESENIEAIKFTLPDKFPIPGEADFEMSSFVDKTLKEFCLENLIEGIKREFKYEDCKSI
ncbi:HD domain-containing protein [Sphingobacterium faecium]|uniref:HD domain-containing protein n=1 Tax=Sphingobacterium faecium TaxID=34087 RepID=UPI002479762C|nr:hypothetical protein [Sphingobacterium faecium]WGQ15035.1 hypothetical protein QG727_01200 [Sphingobacterium faecium]